MLAIGRALMAKPECILMDEPLEGSGPAVVKDVLGLIRELGSAGIGVLPVEQHVDAAVSVADHMLVMGKGTIAFSGTSAEFRNWPHLRADYFGAS
jgi:branched-chain amino acid transport system ATP-binding protein